MKTKKLIELLQKEDPSGEGEVLIPTEDGNVDIHFIDTVEGYWDGSKQIMVRDKENDSIIGAEYRSDGMKIRILTMGIRDALLDNPDLPIKVVDNFVEKKMQKWVDDTRKEIKDIWEKVNKKYSKNDEPLKD